MTKGELLLNHVRPSDIVSIKRKDLASAVKKIFKFCDVDTKLYAGFNFWTYLLRSKSHLNGFNSAVSKEEDYVGSIADANVFRLRNHPNKLIMLNGVKKTVFEYDFDYSKQPISSVESDTASQYPHEGTTLINTDINVQSFIRWAIHNKRRFPLEVEKFNLDVLCDLLNKSYSDWENLYLVLNKSTWNSLINDKRILDHYVACAHMDSVSEGLFGDFIFNAKRQPAILIVDSNSVFSELHKDRFVIVSNTIRSSCTYDVKIKGEFDG